MNTTKTLILFIVLITLTSFGEKVETNSSLDFKAEENAINNLLDNIIISFEKQDAATLVGILSNEVIVLGSAPEQIFNKEQISTAWTQVLEQTSLLLNPVGERQIRIASDGFSASAIEQFTMPDAYPNIVFRNAFHLVKENKEWKVLCWNSACIMSDEDLLRVSTLLSK